jgi:hypothetical protein
MRTIKNIKRKFKKGKYYKVRIECGDYWLLRFHEYKRDGTIVYSDIGTIQLYNGTPCYHEYCRSGVCYTEEVETMEIMSDEDVIKYFKHRFGNI